MASNDAPIEKPDAPAKPFAFLNRIVSSPFTNDQTPVRITCLLVLAGVLAATPMPFQVIGIVTLVILALSYGHVRKG